MFIVCYLETVISIVRFFHDVQYVVYVNTIQTEFVSW